MSDPGSSSPAESSPQDRLDDLQDRIDAAREVVNDGTELEEEPRFIDSGDESDPEDVDNTIVPPG